MFWKLATIACVLSYGILPYRAALCGALLPRPAQVAQAPAKQVAAPKCLGCRAGKPRCFPAPQAEPPRRLPDDSRCGSCRCCPAKDPVTPPPPPEPRTISAKPVMMPPDMARCVPTGNDGVATALRLGHDPPGSYISNNDRLAQTAVWLK
jgi:hypothetical protein